ncbi:MAG: hypothetical protein LQ349_002979 [Xanthoria aureola]|nr:MAG: hypothetical protein LQ349_002979 [Xanthoria aureola]
MHDRATLDPNYDLNGFMAFEQSFNYAPQSMVPPPHSPSHSIRRSSIPQQLPRESSLDVQADFEIYEPGQGRSSDDERDNLTPAQSRRKAQNRAAYVRAFRYMSRLKSHSLTKTSDSQRAFRERKERHVKDLEGKLNNITSQNNSLLAEIERLRRENEKFATQNEILQATATPLGMNHNRPGFNGHATHPASPAAGPMHFSPMTSHHVVSSPRERIVSPSPHRIDFLPSTGERVYGTGATWDFIQNHELFRQGIVDIALVSQRLQQHAICDGSGPAFAESAIIRAIEDSIGGAADELM